MPKRNRKKNREGNAGANRPYSGGKAATAPRVISEEGSSSQVVVTRIVQAPSLGASLPPLVITYTNELRAIEQWLQQHVLQPDAKCIGMDTESKPCFTSEAAKAARNPDTLQLAVADGHCVVIHLSRMERITNDSRLVRVLKSKEIAKAGVGVVDDSLELHKNHSLDLCCRLDLRDIAEVEKQQKKAASRGSTASQEQEGRQQQEKLGLKVLAEKYVKGLVLPKKKRLQMSNWAASLTNDQIEYAAADAFAGVAAVAALAVAANKSHTHQSLIDLALTDELDISQVEQDRAVKKQQRRQERCQRKATSIQNKANQPPHNASRQKKKTTKAAKSGSNNSSSQRRGEHSKQDNAVAPIYQQLSTGLNTSR